MLADATRRLRATGSSSPRLDAELLLATVLGVERVALLAHPERIVGSAQEHAFRDLVQRRAAAEPMAYILGEREFFGRLFKVDKRALIPRPETELLVELGMTAVDRLRAAGIEPKTVEVGTGTGAVAVSLAAERNVNVIATDVSPDALHLARENACRLRQSQHVHLVQADLLTGLRGPFNVIVANLPYVRSTRSLPADVADFEPHVALFGGPRGTELIERLLHQARHLMDAVADVCVELDEEDQAVPVAALARHLYPSADVHVVKDAGGYDRVVHVLL